MFSRPIGDPEFIMRCLKDLLLVKDEFIGIYQKLIFPGAVNTRYPYGILVPQVKGLPPGMSEND